MVTREDRKTLVVNSKTHARVMRRVKDRHPAEAVVNEALDALDAADRAKKKAA